MGELPKGMQRPRSARAIGDNTDVAWWYVNPRTIDIMAHVNDGKGGPNYCGQVRLTRKQLEQALAVMERV